LKQQEVKLGNNKTVFKPMDLVDMYSEYKEKKRRRPTCVIQLTSCNVHVRDGLKYGILTSWFCIRHVVQVGEGEDDLDDQLLISEPVTPSHDCDFQSAVDMKPSRRVVERNQVRYEAFPNNKAHKNDKVALRKRIIAAVLELFLLHRISTPNPI
jgi:hypothetical protein